MERVIRKRLEKLRYRLRAASAVDRGTRTLFYALLLVCGVLAATRFFQWPVPQSVLVIVPGVMLLAGLLSGWLRRLTIHDCAVAVDRKLGLDDRVATSLEAKGAFESALAEDTARVLDQKDLSPLGRIRWPRETIFLLVSVPLAAFLWFAPSPESSERKDPELLVVAQRERGRLIERLDEAKEAGIDSELEEIVALLVDPTPEKMQEVLVRLRSLEEHLEKRIVDTRHSAAEMETLRMLAGSLSAGGAGVARALEKKGLLSPAWEPLSPLVRTRLAGSGLEGGRHPSERPSGMVLREASAGKASLTKVRGKVTGILERQDWPPQYDAAIRNYFSDDPERPVSQRR